MLGGGSAGRATGRAPLRVVEGLTATGWAARAAGLAAVFFFVERAAPVRAVVRWAVVRLVVVRLVVVRLVADFLPPAFFAVLRLAVARLAVDFLPPARFAVLRLAVAFFDDFFFAAISPPFGCAMHDRALWFTGMGTRCCYLRFIASAPRKDKHLSLVTDSFSSRSHYLSRDAGRRRRSASPLPAGSIAPLHRLPNRRSAALHGRTAGGRPPSPRRTGPPG